MIVSEKRGYACAIIVYTQANKLVLYQFDTLYTLCRHIEHMHEGVWLTKTYSQNNSYENFTIFPACIEKAYEKMTAIENLKIFPAFIEQGLLTVLINSYHSF